MSGITFHSCNDYITITLTFFSSILALLMAFKYALAGEKNRGDLFLCILMFLVFAWRLSDGFRYLDDFHRYFELPITVDMVTTIAYFYTGPFVFLYGNYYISYQDDSDVTMLPHMVIPSLNAAMLISVSVFTGIKILDDSWNELINTISVNAATVLVCVYVAFLLVKILILLKDGSMSQKNFLFILGVISLLVMGASLAYMWGDRLVISILVLTALITQYLFVDMITVSLQIVRDEAARGAAPARPDCGQDVDAIMEKIEIMMSWDKVYHDSRLTLKSFAERLEIPQSLLSDILKIRSGLGFIPYINNYRINEARVILEREKHTPVMDIASRVGFNSLSVFYTVFKKITGVSPGSYQKFIKK